MGTISHSLQPGFDLLGTRKFSFCPLSCYPRGWKPTTARAADATPLRLGCTGKGKQPKQYTLHPPHPPPASCPVAETKTNKRTHTRPAVPGTALYPSSLRKQETVESCKGAGGGQETAFKAFPGSKKFLTFLPSCVLGGIYPIQAYRLMTLKDNSQGKLDREHTLLRFTWKFLTLNQRPTSKSRNKKSIQYTYYSWKCLKSPMRPSSCPCLCRKHRPFRSQLSGLYSSKEIICYFFCIADKIVSEN
jgi:hypothetical protein